MQFEYHLNTCHTNRISLRLLIAVHTSGAGNMVGNSGGSRSP